MKSKTKILVVAAGLAGGIIGSVSAQTSTNIHSFSYYNGTFEYAGLIQSGGVLYGVTPLDGVNSKGSVFRVNLDGTGYTNLHSFAGTADGSNPQANLTLSGNTLYGAAYNGGSAGKGTIFSLQTDGSGFTNLHNFSSMDGINPVGVLLVSGGSIFGTAYNGGTNNNGTIFKMSTNGSAFTVLYTFSTSYTYNAVFSTNLDGSNPNGGMIILSNTLYGTTGGGGTGGAGTVFAMQTNGSGYTNLHTFSNPTSSVSTNDDGAYASAGLLYADGVFYCTTTSGGTTGNGNIFKIQPDGSGFTVLYNFSPYNFSGGYPFPNPDGASPSGKLVLKDSSLYGTALAGGDFGNGSLFCLSTNGSGFTNLHSFSALSGSAKTNLDGATPNSDAVISGNKLFVTTFSGGANGGGSLFSYSLPIASPLLQISLSGTNVVLSWTNTATGFTLQSSTNDVSPFTWTTVTPAPANVGGQFVVTNAPTDYKRYFRLMQ